MGGDGKMAGFVVWFSDSRFGSVRRFRCGAVLKMLACFVLYYTRVFVLSRGGEEGGCVVR